MADETAVSIKMPAIFQLMATFLNAACRETNGHGDNLSDHSFFKSKQSSNGLGVVIILFVTYTADILFLH